MKDLDQCILRAIQQEVRRLDCKLDNPRTGLAEIKSEVAAIECAIKDLDMRAIVCKLKDLAEDLEDVLGEVDDIEDKLDNPRFGLKEIKEEIEAIGRAVACLNLTPVLGLLNQIKHEVHEIECKLDNPDFGLEEIKEEVAAIEDAVTNPKTGLPEILEEIEEVEDLLENPDFGLEELKREVAAIECKLEHLNNQQLLALLAAIKGVVLVIEQEIQSPEHGLEEIKEEVAGIEETLCDNRFGLREIKDEIEGIECLLKKLELQELFALLGAIEAEVQAIECKLDNPEWGLAEIREEIEEIIANQGNSTAVKDLTSGPVFRGNGSNSVLVTVINNDAASQDVRLEAFSRLPTLGALSPTPLTLNVAANTAAAAVFDLPTAVTMYEVRVHFEVPGSVSAFSASRSQDENAPLAASSLLPENTIRYAEFKPLFFPPA